MISTKTKYTVDFTSSFKKSLKKIKKQVKNIQKLAEITEKLANLEELEAKYKNHKLINTNYYKECYECHIEPDWLLVYKYHDEKLILILVETGSHSELF